MLRLSAILLLLAHPAAANPSFTEDFSQALSPSWKVAEGNWSAQDGRACTEGKFGRLELADFTGQDVDVAADVAYQHDAPHCAAGVQVRLQDDGTGYAVGLREIERGVHPQFGPWERPLIQLYRMDHDGWKLLQESKVMDCRSGELRRIRVQCKGPDLFVYYEDLETPILREFDDTYQKPGNVALWKDHTGRGLFDNVTIANTGTTPTPSLRTDWSWVRVAIYVRSDAVNSVQMWDHYWDHTELLDRELGYAATYGFNMVQVYLHWIVWDHLGNDYLKRIDDFLTRAARHGLKVNLIFWDDCGHVEPTLDFSAPVPGRHNSQMMPNPSHRIRDSREKLLAYQEKFCSYVVGIASRFKDDSRISFWQIYNEAMGAKETYRTSETDKNIDTLLKWTRDWIKGTGTTIPVTATGGGFQGPKYSDFPSYHSYSGVGQPLPNTDGGPEHLCSETLNRPNADVPKILREIGGHQNGFVVWELMLGRDNCRYPWGHPDGLAEPATPFHGVIYPDGHPWDVAEIRALMGDAAFDRLELFEVTYFHGDFDKEIKKSVTPIIDFKLGDEPGTGSPDASAGIAKDDFSILWTGNFTAPEDGEYTFHAATDGTVEMKIGKDVVLSAVGDTKVVRTFKKGQLYPLMIRYHHRTGDASLRMSWSTSTRPEQLLKVGP